MCCLRLLAGEEKDLDASICRAEKRLGVTARDWESTTMYGIESMISCCYARYRGCERAFEVRLSALEKGVKGSPQV